MDSRGSLERTGTLLYSECCLYVSVAAERQASCGHASSVSLGSIVEQSKP